MEGHLIRLSFPTNSRSATGRQGIRQCRSPHRDLTKLPAPSQNVGDHMRDLTSSVSEVNQGRTEGMGTWAGKGTSCLRPVPQQRCLQDVQNRLNAARVPAASRGTKSMCDLTMSNIMSRIMSYVGNIFLKILFKLKNKISWLDSSCGHLSHSLQPVKVIKITTLYKTKYR